MEDDAPIAPTTISFRLECEPRHEAGSRLRRDARQRLLDVGVAPPLRRMSGWWFPSW